MGWKGTLILFFVFAFGLFVLGGSAGLFYK